MLTTTIQTNPNDILNKLLSSDKKITGVYFNADYTPYSVKRDIELQQVCDENQVSCYISEDVLLNPIESITTGSGSVYQKFTPYFNAAKKVDISKPKTNNYKNYAKSNSKSKSKNLPGLYTGSLEKFYKHNDDLWIRGGRKIALNILKNISDFKDYNKKRNDLNQDTTYLSAANKFGVVSIREVYWAFRDKLGMKNDLIKQLYWRDFYYNLVWKYPHVIGKSLKPKYDKIKWWGKKSNFEKWKTGHTGFPIVDAAMRSMNATGFMHNRARLIVSSFLIKILLLDWRLGEKYFAQKLVDYDQAVNNGNWQWGSGSGADSQPYFRIFNPWTQGKTYDPNGTYIKKWLPELSNVEAKHLHQWDKYYSEYNKSEIGNYPGPIVDYTSQRKEALEMYKAVM